MDIKCYCIVILGMIVISATLTSICMESVPYTTKNPIKNPNLKIGSAETNLVDKVYAFTKDNSTLTFNNNIFFEKPFYYEIYVCVVTPHTCNMTISLLDPEGDPYDVFFENNMTQDNSRITPFGTAVTGNYTITFEASLIRNLNIHIKIEKWIKCLYDVIPPEELKALHYYDVQKFKNGNTINFNCIFRSDWYYKFYFQRVSPISKLLDSSVEIDHNVLSTANISYIIYHNEVLPGMDFNVTIYRFGTAVMGKYCMNITIRCKVPCVNIAFAIVERYQITDVINPNDPEPPAVDPVNNTQKGIEVSFPPEFIIGTLIFFGCVVGTPILIIVVRKRKNPT